jgi:hypothetical protein
MVKTPLGGQRMRKRSLPLGGSAQRSGDENDQAVAGETA